MSIDYEKLKIDFIAESTTLLQKMETAVLGLEQQFSDDDVNEAFRAVHTIKGNSAIFENDFLENLAHEAENVLSGMRSGSLTISPAGVDTLLLTVDLLREIVQNLDQASETTDRGRYDSIMKALAEWSGSATNGSAGQPAAVQPETAAAVEEVPTVQKPTETESKSRAAGTVVPPDLSDDETSARAVRLSDSFLQKAREAKVYISLVIVDLMKQTAITTVEEFLQSLKQAAAEGSAKVIRYGILKQGLPPLDTGEPGCPYYLVIASKEPFTREQASRWWTVEEVTLEFNPHGSPTVTDVAEDITVTAAGNSEQGTASVDGKNGSSSADEPPAAEVHEPTAVPSVPPSSGSAAPAAAASPAAVKESHLKVSLDLLDRLVNVTGEAVIAKNEFQQYLESITDSRLHLLGKKLNGLILNLQEIVLKTRLQPLQIVYDRLPRIVRDVASVTGKQVLLEMEGGEVELDKNLIDSIIDPFTHIIRNSIDHGIESPEKRRELGKGDKGRLKIRASLKGGKVVITTSDDGRGFSIEAIKNKAIEKGMLTVEEAARLSRKEILDLVFQPGFSTAGQVTSTSGRGVGMDVVRRNLRKINGSVEINSEEGEGSEVQMTVPQTMSIITCLLVKTNGRRYAIHQKNIKEVIRIDANERQNIIDKTIYRLRGKLLPLVNLSEVLYPGAESTEAGYVVVIRLDGNEFGLLVEEIINTDEIVVKPLGSELEEIVIYSGVAILGDGDSILILDVAGLAAYLDMKSASLKADIHDDQISSADDNQALFMFRIGSQLCGAFISQRPRILKLENRRVKQFGGHDVFDLDGKIVPIVHLEEQFNIVKEEGSDRFAVLFDTGALTVAVASSDIVNVTDDYPPVEDASFAGKYVQGQFILAEEAVMVVDMKSFLEDLVKNRFDNLLLVKEA